MTVERLNRASNNIPYQAPSHTYLSGMERQNTLLANDSAKEIYDFIIIGAGIGGTVVASRLHERDPSLLILLIEAGPDSSKTELADVIASPMKVALLKGSELDWYYETVPQKNLDGLKLYVGAGKAIGGGSVINYGISFRVVKRSNC